MYLLAEMTGRKAKESWMNKSSSKVNQEASEKRFRGKIAP